MRSFLEELEDIVIGFEVEKFINTLFFKTNLKMIILMQRKTEKWCFSED